MASRMDVAVGVVEVPVALQPATMAWPVSWSGVWVGALASLAAALLGSLLAVALGAYAVTPGARVGPEDLGAAELIASVCISFFAFVLGGWAATRIGGFRRAETAMLHGAILWTVAVPMLMVLVAFGARAFGGWYSGLAGAPVWAAPGTPVAAEAAREAAGGAATALLLGLIGAVVGAWFGSGEPMTLTYHRHRDRTAFV